MDAFGPKTFEPKEAILHRIRFYASRARPCMPNLETIQFLKARMLPRHQLHYVTFQCTTGQHWYFTYFLKQERDDSWHVRTSYGDYERRELVAILNYPWVDLQVGENSLHEFLTGGEVIDHGFDIVRVRLLSPNGRVLEDTVQDGLVLFWTDKEVFLPMQADLYNRAGELVTSHSVLACPPAPDTKFGGFFRPAS